jgi:hypothetical protein
MDALKTGDCLLTHGGGIVSLLIRLFTGAWFKWNHVAMIIQTPLGIPYVYECTASVDRPDGIDGTVRRGVRAERYDSWIDAQGGKVWLARLKTPLTSQEADDFDNEAIRLWNERTPYGFLEAFNSASPWTNKRSLNRTFCSAFYIDILTKIGRLPADTNWQEWTPNDVAHLEILQTPKRIK